MTAVIFDMDGVLVESMPYHYQAMKTAIKEVANIDLEVVEIAWWMASCCRFATLFANHDPLFEGNSGIF
jgi:beta-phosphoglucomutase-like phosphatase (HAD superfamily)